MRVGTAIVINHEKNQSGSLVLVFALGILTTVRVLFIFKSCTVVLEWKMPISHGIGDKAKRPSAIQKKYPHIRNNHFLSLILLSTLSIWGEIRNNYQQALIYLLLCFRQTVLALHRFDPNNIVDYQRVTSHLTLRI